MTDILTLAKENGFSHIGFADMSALTPLTAGCCTLEAVREMCAKCTYPDKPCRYPSKRLSSMEAFGLFVSDICARSGLDITMGRVR